MIAGRELTAAGVRTVLREVGPASSAEAVVFVHGSPGSSADWIDLMEVVAPLARAVAWDAPGFGQAEKDEGFEQTVAGHTAYLAAVLEELGIERVHLVGHDFGGAWALAWAAGHLSQVRSVVLMNSGVARDYHWHYLAKIWRIPGVGNAFMATTSRLGFRLLLKHGNPRGLPHEFVDRMYDDLDRGTRRAILRLYRATDQPSDVSELVAALRTVSVPTLVLWGARDPYIPRRFAQQQREAFPQAEIVMLEDSGHWPFVDNPEAVAEAIGGFYNRVLGSAAA